MFYIRRNLNFWEFLSELWVSGIVGLILTGFFPGLIGTILYDDGYRQPAITEQNLYLALNGKETDNEIAVKTADLIKSVYESYSSELLNNLKEYVNALDDDDVSYYLAIAVQKWDNVELILKQPGTNIKVEIPTWVNWWRIFGLMAWIIFAICFSVSYVIFAHNNAEWWQYPWNRWWAYPAVIFLLPYVVMVQSGLAIYALIREIKGYGTAERKIIKATEAEKEAYRRGAIHEKISSIGSKAESFRNDWINIQEKNAWEREKKELKALISEHRAYLSQLGQDVGRAQRTIAENEAKIAEIEKITKGNIVKKTADELSREFDELLRLNGLKAVEISGHEIRLYTDAIVMPQASGCGKTNFLVKINTKTGSVKIAELYSNKEIKFCFGDNVRVMADNIKQKNYLPAIAYILQAIQ